MYISTCDFSVQTSYCMGPFLLITALCRILVTFIIKYFYVSQLIFVLCVHGIGNWTIFMPMSHEALKLRSENEVHYLKQECFPAVVLSVHLSTGPATPSLSNTTGARVRFRTLTANQWISILSLKPVEDSYHHHQALTIIGIHRVGILYPKTKVFPPRALILSLSRRLSQYHEAYTPNSTQVTRAVRTDITNSLQVNTKKYQCKTWQPTTKLLPLAVNQLVLLWNSLAVSEDTDHRAQPFSVVPRTCH